MSPKRRSPTGNMAATTPEPRLQRSLHLLRHPVRAALESSPILMMTQPWTSRKKLPELRGYHCRHCAIPPARHNRIATPLYSVRGSPRYISKKTGFMPGSLLGKLISKTSSSVCSHFRVLVDKVGGLSRVAIDVEQPIVELVLGLCPTVVGASVASPVHRAHLVRVQQGILLEEDRRGGRSGTDGRRSGGGI